MREPSSKIEVGDTIIGQKIQAQRAKLGYSIYFAATNLGIAPQQFDKYERGINRISASKLFTLAPLLKVNMDYFDPGPNDRIVAISRVTQRRQVAASKVYSDLVDTDNLQLIKAFHVITKELPKNIKETS